MADRNAYELDDGYFRRTQSDAKKSGRKWKKVSIPVDSEGLINWANKLIDRERAGDNPPAPTEEPAAAAEPPASPPPPVNTSTNPTWAQQREAKVERQLAIDEEILNASYEEARRIQSLANERMVEHLVDMKKRLIPRLDGSAMLAHTAGMAQHLEYRLMLRAVVDILAEPLEGDAREAFTKNSDAIINRAAPAPGKSQKRLEIKPVE